MPVNSDSWDKDESVLSFLSCCCRKVAGGEKTVLIDPEEISK